MTTLFGRYNSPEQTSLLCSWVFAVTGLVTVVFFGVGVELAHGRQGKQGQPNTIVKKAGNPATDDLVCGPRCVQYLLQYYGREADLIELVREIQWPDLASGASLDALDKALNERGIHTFGMQLAPQARLEWPYPVLIHLKVEGAEIGHYAVWLPSSSGKVALWNGLLGIQQVSGGELAKCGTGAILLTAPKTITNPASAVKGAGLPTFTWVLCFSGVVCVLFVFTVDCVRKHVWRCLSPLSFVLFLGEKS